MEKCNIKAIESVMTASCGRYSVLLMRPNRAQLGDRLLSGWVCVHCNTAM